MVGMPYDLEKGPYFSVVEDFLDDDERLIGALLDLRKGADIARIGVLDSPALDRDGWTPLERARHLNEDWFGMRWDREKKTWHRQAQHSCSSPPDGPTGFWQNWHGDAEAIFRETLVRAIEVSLGVDHGQRVSPGDTPPRRWPIEIFWKCQGPWFEGWVTWRRHGRGRRGGQVTVILATPGNGSPLWRSPKRDDKVDEYEENPVSASPEHGMWVVTHDHEHQFGSSVRHLTVPTPAGEFPVPAFGGELAGCGPIVVVSPAERDGGVMGRGRRYEPRPSSRSTIPKAAK